MPAARQTAELRSICYFGPCKRDLGYRQILKRGLCHAGHWLCKIAHLDRPVGFGLRKSDQHPAQR